MTSKPGKQTMERSESALGVRDDETPIYNSRCTSNTSLNYRIIEDGEREATAFIGSYYNMT